MTPEFAHLVNPTFHYVLALVDRLENGGDVKLEYERNRIRGELQDAELTVSSPDHPVSKDDFDIARRALVYWVDEVLSVADPRWKDLILEDELYGSRQRAWQFYVYAESQARNCHPDVIETFYLSMVLGFVGDMRDAFLNHLRRPLPGNVDDPEKARQVYGKDLSKQIRQSQPGSGPQAPQLLGNVRPLMGGKLFSVAMGSLVLVLLVLALILALPKDKNLKSKSKQSDATRTVQSQYVSFNP
ncbi:MAG: DotU family type IV/VI secretion system protein [Planctomycetota bacterium]|nr:DotU family type IV/VI secretion system protein [Planctomycetota bacterium]